VIAVDEINVGVAGRAEQDGVTSSIAGGGVSSGIVGSEVSFDFDDAGCEADRAFADQDFAEKCASYPGWSAGEKGAVQGLNGDRIRTSGVFLHSIEIIRAWRWFCPVSGNLQKRPQGLKPKSIKVLTRR
jgi:hypothetical protein